MIATSTDNIPFEALGRVPLSGTARYSLKSRHVDQTFVIDVAMPAMPIATMQALPVVYVLDGNSTFAMAAQTARMLQSGPSALPPALIVGIGYRFDRSRDLRTQFFETRTRDFTSTTDHDWLEMSRAALAAEGREIHVTPGGAAAFLAFINDELKPFLASRYDIDAEDQTLTGMSLGGFFTLYTLFQSPGSFARYAAFSPALWWDDRQLFKDETALASRTADLPVQLFLSVGDLEEADGPPYLPVSNLGAMNAVLRSRRYRSLKLTHQVFAGETHMSVYPASISRGLRVLFDAPLSNAAPTAPAA